MPARNLIFSFSFTRMLTILFSEPPKPEPVGAIGSMQGAHSQHEHDMARE